MKTTAVMLGAVLAVASCAVAAQSYPYQNELSIFGSWDKVDEPIEIEVTNVQLRYGRFFSPRLVGTLGLSRTRFESNASDDVATALTIGAKYYFGTLRTAALVPFVDGAVGIANTDHRLITMARAFAVRVVTALSPTSTIAGRLPLSTWVSLLMRSSPHPPIRYISTRWLSDSPSPRISLYRSLRARQTCWTSPMRSASLAPLRSGPRRSVPAFAKRQV